MILEKILGLGKTCSRCVLPEDFPGANFDERGICQPCRDYDAGEGPYGWKNRSEIEKLANVCEGYFEEAKQSGANYECIVSVSGGKDSAALASKAIDLGMYPLLITIDTGFLDPQALSNINTIIPTLNEKSKAKLGKSIEHQFLAEEDIMRTLEKIYRRGFLNPDERGFVHTICYTCAPLMEDIAMDIATKEGIPLVLEGYSPHQPDYDFMFFEMPDGKIGHSHVPEWMTDEEGFSEDDRKWFWDPEKYPEGTGFPRVIAPWHVIGYNERLYNQNDIYKAIVRGGMVSRKGKAKPGKTNCYLNWPMMLLDNILLGHNPYIEEFARQVRDGMTSRTEWLITIKAIDKFVGKPMRKKEIEYVMNTLGLDMEKLKEIAREAREKYGI